ncbi:hypothetical protein [Marinomonas foliarum]|uniref:Uncharacterized protein n=1 Tax=Marinomonas foliarum TaxID=491950 RepID=A0A369ACF5_9GAMM|nr:hypothetical protein [Marinomonas foliarum]RCX06841.1 hypothetical protein DFP77_108105 [Marinomonas foliarum]
MRSKGRIAAYLVACCPFYLLATDEVAKAAETQPVDQQTSDETEIPWWFSSHETVSNTIGNWSTNIDSFLSGEPSLQHNDSYVEIRFGSVLEKDESSGFFDFSAKLRLPNTQDRLRLVVESESDSLAPESLRGESSQQDNVVSSALKNSISAAVRYIKEDIGLDVDAGIKVDFPLDPFLRFRLTQGEAIGSFEWWQKQEAFAYYSKGVGARYGIGVGYATSPTLNFGMDFGTTWLDKEGLFYVRENFSIQHRVNDKNRLGYQLSFLQSGEHSIEPDSYLYNVQYERLLYKDWLIGQIKPQMTYEAEDDYDGVFSLTLSLAILLGPEYLH